MAKLVVLSAEMTGRTHELTVDKTTIGRVEDNTFQIAEASVSSHHCEVLLRGSDVVIKDLNSTNGTFINNEKISESVLKPGQTLRLGQIELRLEVDGMPAPAPVPANASASAPAPAPTMASAPAMKKAVDQTVVMQRGVSLNDLEQGGGRPAGFDTAGKGFSKKGNKTNRWFLIGGIIAFVLIALVLLYAFSQARPVSH
jgi:predicted component of type VI protein secretion system